MDKIDRSRFENNKFKEEIETILELCDDSEEMNISRSYFDVPIDEEEILAWEQKTGVTIPEDYKEWLRFSRECRIDGPTARFWRPKNFPSKYIPDDLVVIGEMVGDGELVCFSKESGQFVSFFEGSINLHYEDFKEVLKEIIESFRVSLGKPSKEYQDFLDKVGKKLEEFLRKEGKI